MVLGVSIPRGNPNSNSNHSNSNSNSNNEGNNTNNKTKLYKELNNLYGGNNGFLNNGEIKDFVKKLNKSGTNSFSIKQNAYKKSFTKYTNHLYGPFAQNMMRELKRRMKSSPRCPSGVTGGGLSMKGAARMVAGGLMAASKVPLNVTVKKQISQMQHLTSNNKKEFINRINKGEDPKKVRTAATERSKLR